MKMRFPLFARILGWFFLNVLVLAGICALVIFLQFKGQLPPLLNDLAAQRFQGAAHAIHAEFLRAPQQDWSGILKNFSRSFAADFLLLDIHGNVVAGSTATMPDDVRKPLLDGLPPPPGRGLRPEPEEEFGPPDDGPPPPEGVEPRAFGNFVLHAKGRYWIAFRMPPLMVANIPHPVPHVLAVVSSSLTGAGFFADFKPWLIAIFGAIAVSALLWLPFVRGITQRLRQMMGATARIADGSFDVRVPRDRSDELGQLAVAINQMAERLDGFVAGQKRFLGDIAHELCSPIARLQLAVGILEQSGENHAALASVREEAQEMSALVNELLSFSKAALQRREVPLVPVELRPLVEHVIRREAQGFEDFHLEIPEQLFAMADADLLQRALANVVRNASRYAGMSGPIFVKAERTSGHVFISVADSGPGVPDDALPKLFDP